MSFCTHCGRELREGDSFCPGCGAPANNTASDNMNGQYNANAQSNMNTQVAYNRNETAYDDAPSTGYAILGFFIPLVGLILYLVEKDKRPLKAKSAGKGALIGFIVGIVFSIIYGIFVGSMFSSYYYYL